MWENKAREADENYNKNIPDRQYKSNVQRNSGQVFGKVNNISQSGFFKTLELKKLVYTV